MRTYNLTFYTFSGVSIPLEKGLSLLECVDRIKHYNKQARERGQPVTRINSTTWEHGEEDDILMIGDRHGYLKVTRNPFQE